MSAQVASVTPMRGNARARQERYLTPQDVCDMLPGITLDVLKERRKRRVKPDYFKPTGEEGRGAVLYAESDIIAWVRESRVQTREAR